MTLSNLVHPARARLAPPLNAVARQRRVRDDYRRYRRAVCSAGVVLSADVLRSPDDADWVRKHGVPVEVRSRTELRQALSVGIKPARIVLHDDGVMAGPLRCAVNAGVGQFIVGTTGQVAVLDHWARVPQRVLIDVTTRPVDGLVRAVVASDRIELIGLRGRVELIGEMVAQLARIRWESGILVSRLHLTPTVGVHPRQVSAAIEDALDEACARFRFPRPAVALSLPWPVLGG